MARNWQAGDLIMGRYRLVSLLGQGGMGSVWRAEHIELKNQVAIKLLDPAIAENQEMIGRFLREARAAASLQNRHVIQIFDHGVEDGEAFMVMELLEGESLGERLRKGPLAVDDTIKFMVQVMRAMGKAHDAGIIHRDLKPDNIFITHDDEGEYAKVLDFGVAKVGGDLGATNGVKTQTGMMLGTPFYMSPEQAKAKKVDARTDIWALAVISYECLVGKRPFTGESFADLVLTLCNSPIPLPSQSASVPVGFDEWFVHGVQRDVSRRFQSARDMARELLQLANTPMTGKAGSPPTFGFAAQRPARTPAADSRMSLTTGQSAAMGMRTPASGARRPAKNSSLWTFATAAVVLVTGAVGFWAWKTNSASSPEVPVADAAGFAAAGVDRATDDVPAPRPEADGGAHDAETKSVDLENAPAPTPKPTHEQAKPETSTPTAPAPRSAPAATTAPVKEPKKSTPPPAPAPAPSTTGGKVPVVDNGALPPTEWNF